MKELQIYGPPGTGKTTQLATSEIAKAAKMFGPEKILVVSYTKTGAKEIATKRSRLTGLPIPIPKNNVGTLHRICYWALSAPKIAEANIGQWNDIYPGNTISGTSIEKSDDFGSHEIRNNDGDMALNKINILRAKMIDKNLWPQELQGFWKKWTAFKADCGYLDFTDLIEKCLDKFPYAPNRPDVIFVDEAQDMTPLQLKLVRQWGMQAQYLVLCGDDDQTLYTWLGCSPNAFLRSNYSDIAKRVLDQSYRVPIEVYNRAMNIIRRVKIRAPKKYNPRPYKGLVRDNLEGNFRFVDNMIPEIIEKAFDKQTVMVLATCGYMLEKIKEALKSEGIPFHNPYRPRGDWNPLAKGNKNVTARDFLVNFLTDNKIDNQWTVEQFLKWVKYIKVGESGLIRKKAKAGISALGNAVADGAEGLESTKDCIHDILTPSGIEQALNRNIDWFYENMKATRQETVKYPLHVYRKNGLTALQETPKIIIGTIHSVKGGESQCVYLFPDLSKVAQKEIDNTVNIDSLYRLFYVAMTRASEELVLMQNADPVNVMLW